MSDTEESTRFGVTDGPILHYINHRNRLAWRGWYQGTWGKIHDHMKAVSSCASHMNIFGSESTETLAYTHEIASQSPLGVNQS